MTQGDGADTADPLLSEDLGQLLKAFPNEALKGLVGILKAHWSPTPFPAPRAYAAHSLADDADFNLHAQQIADEILWWGSNELTRPFTGLPSWREMLTDVASSVGVPAGERGGDLTACKIEGALLRKAIADWEKLDPAQREAALAGAGGKFDSVYGGLIAAFGGAIARGSEQLLPFLALRGAGAAAGTVFVPAAVVFGAGWAAYEIAGPAMRVIRPVALTVAYTRQRLRDERIANVFKE